MTTQPPHMFLLDITTGVVKEVMHHLDGTVEASKTVQVLPQLGHPISLENIYIPVKVSQQRLMNISEQRAEEGRRLRGESDDEKRAFAPRGEEGFEHFAERTQEPVVRQWNKVRRERQRMVILGDPGQGKTTLLTRERWQTAKESLEKLRNQEAGPSSPGIEIPVYLRLAEVFKSGKSLIEQVENPPGTSKYPPAFHNWLKGALQRGQVVILLDALDEVYRQEDKDQIKEELRDLIEAYPTCRYILNSRIVGYDTCALASDGKTYELVLFGNKEVEHFVDALFAGKPDMRTGFMTALRGNPSIRNIGRNPLLLSLLCQVYETGLGLPQRATDLYDKCLNNLLVEWRAKKGFSKPTDEVREDKKDLLREVAFELWAKGSEYFSARELRDLMRQRPQYESLSAIAPEHSLIKDFAEQDGILVRAGVDDSNVPYMFLHLTFQEYLTAGALAERVNKHGWDAKITAEGKEVTIRYLIDKKAWDSRWQQVIIFFAGQLDDPEPLVQLLYDPETDDLGHHRLRLAAVCLPEVPSSYTFPIIAKVVADITTSWLSDRLWGKDFDTCFCALARRSSFIQSLIIEVLETTEFAFRQRRINSIRLNGDNIFDLSDLLESMLQDILITDSGITSRFRHVVHEIGNSADPRIVGTLISIAQNEFDYALRVKALHFLGADFGDLAEEYPNIIDILLDIARYQGLSGAAIETIGNLGPKAANHPNLLETLYSLALGEDESLKISARKAFGRLAQRTTRSARFLNYLDEIIRDRMNGPLRREAVTLIGCLGEGAKEVSFILESLLNIVTTDPNPVLRGYVLSTIRTLNSGDGYTSQFVLTLTRAAVQENDPSLRSQILKTVSAITVAGDDNLDSHIVAALMPLFTNETDNNLRESILEIFALLGKAAATFPNLTQTLLKMAREPESRSWLRIIIRTLSEIGNKSPDRSRILHFLIDVALENSENDGPRYQAIDGLCNFAINPENQRALQTFLKTIVSEARGTLVCIYALEKLGYLCLGEEHHPHVLEYLLNAPYPVPLSEYSRKYAAKGLAKLDVRLFEDNRWNTVGKLAEL